MASLWLIQYRSAPGLSLAGSSPAINAFVQLSYISTFAFFTGVATDRWLLDNGYIYLAGAPDLVIGIGGTMIENGALLLLGQKLPGRQPFQQWDWTTEPPYIKNAQSPQYVIDCVNGLPGTTAEIRELNGTPAQQWILTPL